LRLYKENLSRSDCHLFPAPKQNLSGHKFKNDFEVETLGTCWLLIQDMDFHQAGKKRVSHDVDNASLVTGAVGKVKLCVNWPIILEIKYPNHVRYFSISWLTFVYICECVCVCVCVCVRARARARECAYVFM
jgi:hypothetical protein